MKPTQAEAILRGQRKLPQMLPSMWSVFGIIGARDVTIGEGRSDIMWWNRNIATPATCKISKRDWDLVNPTVGGPLK